MNNKKITISTLGSCVTRDIFRIADKEKLFEKEKYVGFISPFSIFTRTKIDIAPLINQIKADTMSEFDKRNRILDLNGEAIDFLCTKISDYLIIDLMDLRLEVMSKDTDIAVSVRKFSREAELTKSYFEKKGYQLIKPDKVLEDQLFCCLKRLSDEIKKHWKPEKIILIEAYPTQILRNKNGEIDNSNKYKNLYNTTCNYSKLFSNGYKILKDELKCRCVEMPNMEYVMADENHTWGVFPLHYTDKVYEYLYDSICSIAISQEYNEKKAKDLEELKDEYFMAKRKGNDKLNQTNNKKLINIYNYFDWLKEQKDCMIILSVKDTAGYWFNNILQEKLKTLGLKENLIKKLMVGYIGIVWNSKIIYESIGKKDECRIFSDQIGGHHISIISMPYLSGNLASIKIDGQEFACNKRGINIVTFEISKNKVIDSVCFDTHVEALTFSRKDLISDIKFDFRLNLRESHYDICLVGCWWGANYGSCLNGYAVYKILKSFGLSVLMLNKHNAQSNDWEIVNTHNAKFIKKFYPENEVSPIIPFNELYKLNYYCDTFLAGSDQIWNYGINRIFDMAFMLNFVDNSKKKISFGTSFGHGTDGTPKAQLPYLQELLKRFDSISLREESGVEICKNIYGVDATQVLEPVFCLDASEYRELSKLSNISESEPYILTYILDPTPEKRQAIEYYSKISGRKVINVLDGDPRVYEKNKKILDLPNIMGKISAEDLMKLYLESSFVISDSFHGTAFAIIFNKPFLAIANAKRGIVRFKELLGKFNLLNRLALNQDQIPLNSSFLDEIDYSSINTHIREDRDRSISWLKNAIDQPKQRNKAIIPEKSVSLKLNPDLCVGCGACASICPVDAIQIKPDDLGYYRSAIDYSICINCGKCSEVCPALNVLKCENSKEPECFEFIAADNDTLMQSTSGGIFSLLSEYVLSHKGIVIGAAWNDDFTVKHIIAETNEEVQKLRKSKYLQSYLGSIFKLIKVKLEQGAFVLFSGCPCQIAGLKLYLKRDYKNLIMVDIFCGSAPSSMFFKKYLDDLKPIEVEKYTFRYKSNDIKWDCSHVKIETKNGKQYILHGSGEDNYQRIYHDHTMCPTHCEKCKYQIFPRLGDISIGDFWGIGQRDQTISTEKGVSVVLCNNEKGKKVLEQLPKEKIGIIKKVPLDWLGENSYATHHGKNFVSKYRDAFYNAIKTKTFSEAMGYALKANHGMNKGIVFDKKTFLQYNAAFLHFQYDPNVWEEQFENNKTRLIVKPNMSKPRRFAILPLYKTLCSKKIYEFSIFFKLKTESNIINFHIKDSSSNCFQIIHSYHMPVDKKETDWEELRVKFSPKADIYDQFMIGASQISGENNYIIIDYINIIEIADKTENLDINNDKENLNSNILLDILKTVQKKQEENYNEILKLAEEIKRLK